MPMNADPRDATAATQAANQRVRDALPWEDRADFDFAQRGFIDTLPDGIIRDAEGEAVWNVARYAFLDDEAPDTANPSLWRHSQLNAIHGLFEVCDGIYQVRAFDVSNVTFIAGKTGWIVVDPLTNIETAQAAFALLDKHFPGRPVHAVIYTHSHVDHFGGVQGIVSVDDVRSGKVQVLAPEGFMEAAISENVIAGTAMSRRALYQFGTFLEPGPRGQLDGGMGKTMPTGTISIIAPTDVLTTTGEEREIDGLRFVFQMAPGTEAPAELCFFLPERRALCMAELCTASFHNYLTLRGAQARDSLSWSKYIDEAIELFSADADVLFAQHNWPRFGNEAIVEYMRVQRDVYRYVHDQAMRLANAGETMHELAEQIDLPESIAQNFHARGYYGTVNHNAKAVYQRYLGWFDGNPAHLHAHPPAESAKRHVAFMGGAAAVIEKAEKAYAEGDYRWVAEVVNYVVFAEPENEAGRDLQARALEQLGYQSESAIWRNFYLAGALELRHGVAEAGHIRGASVRAMIEQMSLSMLFDAMGVRVNGPAAAENSLQINWTFTDTGEKAVLRIQNGTLSYQLGRHADDADATLEIARATLNALAAAPPTGVAEAFGGADLKLDGPRPEAVFDFFGLLAPVEERFPIVTP